MKNKMKQMLRHGLQRFKMGQRILFVRRMRMLSNYSSSINYEVTRKLWEEPDRKVHSDVSKEAIKEYGEYIGSLLHLKNGDRILCIGCGDALIDSYLFEAKGLGVLYGFDFSAQMVKKAKERNPKGIYWQQNFLEKYDLSSIRGDMDATIFYSFSVVQYCKCEDLQKFFSQQMAICKEGVKYKICHADIPDIEKAYYWWKRFYPKLEEEYVIKWSKSAKAIFDDGSYWHDMNYIKSVIESLGGSNVEIIDSLCDYRSAVSFEYVREY